MAHTPKNGHKTKPFRMPIFAIWLIAIFQHIDTDIKENKGWHHIMNYSASIRT